MGVVKQQNVLLSHLDENGDRILEFPITKPECIDGIEDKIIETMDTIVFNCGTLEDIKRMGGLADV